MSTSTNKTYPVDAATWDACLRAPDCSAAERAAFERWCAEDPANQRAFDQLQNLLEGLRCAREMPEIRSLREAALEAAGPPLAETKGMPWWGLGVAAAVLVAIAAGFFTMVRPDGGTTGSPPSFATAVGERSTTNLKDGTVVVLNTNTRMDVAYSDRERRVTLLHGQALFDVAKDAMRPFVVVAGEQRITAVGTVFDVRFEGDDVHVTLVEGIVDVLAEQPTGSNLTGAAVSPMPVRLAAGQKLLTTAIATSAAPSVEPTDVERATIWRQGRVFFEDAPLSEAVAEMNRYSETEIVVADKALDAHRVNGMFRTGQQANFIDALESYYPLKSEVEAENRILLKSREGN